MTHVTIEQMVARWSDPEARPLFKGRLIDDNGCCCAQGDVLRSCGWSDERLRSAKIQDADRAVAKELGISVTHAALLRLVNDRLDGCPQDVLAHPERILGGQWSRVLAFWRNLDGLNEVAWRTVQRSAHEPARAAKREGAWKATWKAALEVAPLAWQAAWEAAWASEWWGVAWEVAWEDLRRAAQAGVPVAQREAEWEAQHSAAREVAWEAAWATNEIQVCSQLDKYFFLPLFGINNPAELGAA